MTAAVWSYNAVILIHCSGCGIITIIFKAPGWSVDIIEIINTVLVLLDYGGML